MGEGMGEGLGEGLGEGSLEGMDEEGTLWEGIGDTGQDNSAKLADLKPTGTEKLSRI